MQDALEDKRYLRSRVELLEEEARTSSTRWANFQGRACTGLMFVGRIARLAVGVPLRQQLGSTQTSTYIMFPHYQAGPAGLPLSVGWPAAAAAARPVAAAFGARSHCGNHAQNKGGAAARGL